MSPETDAPDDRFDFSDEEPTQREQPQTMVEVLEELRSPGIPTLTSERPTRPIRPMVMWRKELMEEDGNG